MKNFISLQQDLASLGNLVQTTAASASEPPRVFIGGASGVGKTTIASFLSKQLDILHVEGDRISSADYVSDSSGRVVRKWNVDPNRLIAILAETPGRSLVFDSAADNISLIASLFNVVIFPHITNPLAIRKIWRLKAEHLEDGLHDGDLDGQRIWAARFRAKLDWSDTRILNFQWTKMRNIARHFPQISTAYIVRLSVDSDAIEEGWISSHTK